MALQTQVGQFAANTGGATTTVSCNFQGKAIIFWTHGKTTNPESATASWSMGFVDNNAHVIEHGWASDDAVATSNVGQGFQTVRALQIFTNGTPTAGVGGNISSVAFGGSSFTVTFNATPASAWLINFILIGGSDVTNTFVGNFTNPASTSGVQHITTPGFQGNVVFILGSQVTATGTNTSAGSTFGAAVATNKRWVFAGNTKDAQTTTLNAVHVADNTKFMRITFTDQSTAFAADFSGFTATGFDYNITTASASSWEFGFLVIQGGQWDCGTQAKPTTATTQTLTGETFQPSFLGLFTSSPTAFNTVTNTEECSFGATDGTNQVYSNAVELNQFNTVAKSSGSASAVLLDRDGTNNPAATFTSFNSDGWTITWNATGSARQVGWFTAASSPVVTPAFPIFGDAEFQWGGGEIY